MTQGPKKQDCHVRQGLEDLKRHGGFLGVQRYCFCSAFSGFKVLGVEVACRV